ncbi:uncharacterized protein [Malus domestica]|uniref:uncharacterized protein n=1 Tax=Malus domestica TaxID=3750 RepID=UPI003976A0FF
MTTILKSYELWELVENGFEPPDSKDKKTAVDETKKETTKEVSYSEILMKDARALGIIQEVVSDEIFPRIMNEETSKGAWDVLKDIETLEVQEVVASLKGFEQRLDLHAKTSIERASTSLNVATKGSGSGGFFGNKKFHRNWKPRGKGWDHKPNFVHRQNNAQRNWDHVPNYTQKQNNTQGDCKWCDRFHYGKCWYEVTDVKVNNSWYIDSGCSNRMIGDERLLVNIQRNLNSKVKMGNGEIV